MPRQTDWTVSATRLEALKRRSLRLKEILDQGSDADEIEAYIRDVRTSAGRLANGLTFVEQRRGNRIVVPPERFRLLPDLIDQHMTGLRLARAKKPSEPAKVQNAMAKTTGNAIYATIRDALDAPGLERFKLP